jgi:uncharacterized protein involved in type VI secretion and phage assembly
MPPTEPAVPGCQIVLSGAPLDAQNMSLLLDVTVRDSVHVPDTALVRFRDPEGTFITNNDWAIGKELEIKFAASQKDTFTSVFSGEIIAIEPEYGDNGLVVSYRAYDKGWRLNRERKSAIFPDMTAADIIRKVAASAGLQPGTIADGGPKFDIFQQSMETNWEFCWRLARMHNCEFVVQGNKCHFRKRQVTPPVETLVFGAHQFQQPLLSFKPRLSGVGQVTSVEVRNHDPKSHQQIAGVAQTANIPHTSSAVSERSKAVSELAARSVVVADRIAADQQEATALAQTTLDRLASSFVEAEGKAWGNPKLRAGTTVRLDGVDRFNGQYVLSGTTHRFSGGGGRYLTSFVISGRTSHAFRDLLRTGDTDWASSLVIGIVTNNKEQEKSGGEVKLGRVKVKYPGLGDSIESGWARVAVPHAGADRGMFFLPQAGDEVVVAFEHGDTRRPIIIGSLFNGQAKPPAELLATTEGGGGKDPLFGVKTPHESFVDSKQKMTLRSHETMIVEVKKDGKNGTGDYTLDAEGKISAKAATEIKVEAGSSITIKGTGAITIESQAGVKLKGATIDLEATTAVNVKGQIINLG